jgi:hypothetical protein
MTLSLFETILDGELMTVSKLRMLNVDTYLSLMHEIYYHILDILSPLIFCLWNKTEREAGGDLI